MNTSLIVVDKNYKKHIALIRLNRPEALNALNLELMAELRDSLVELDNDSTVRVIIITGNDQAFAAGADIKQMSDKSAIDMLKADQFSTWDQIKKTRKPLIAAVSGFALGGGCELAMTCDMIIASESAKFGQPEIKIGVMPGAGGTQRLTKAMGKAWAMEMILTGKFIDAATALQYGLINRITPVELYLEEAVKLAENIAIMSPTATMLAKEAVLKSFESGLQEGLFFERKNYYLLFAGQDQKEGMSAFIEKRPPIFTGE